MSENKKSSLPKKQISTTIAPGVIQMLGYILDHIHSDHGSHWEVTGHSGSNLVYYTSHPCIIYKIYKSQPYILYNKQKQQKQNSWN